MNTRKLVLMLWLALLALGAGAATVTGILLDPAGQTNRVGVSFRLIRPGSVAPNFIYTQTKTTWTTNAFFSIALQPGNYSLQIGPTPDTVTLSVPNDNGTYNLNDLLGTNFVYNYSFSPLYVQRIGGGGGVMSGNLSFATTNQAGLIANGLTTAQRLALTPTNGMIVYDSTIDQLMRVEAGAWMNFIATAGGSTGAALLLADTNLFAFGSSLRSLAVADTNAFASGVAGRSFALTDTNAFAGAFFRLADTNNFAAGFFRYADTNAFAAGVAGRSLATGDTNTFAGAFFRIADTNAFAAGVAGRSLATGDTNAFAASLFRRADTNAFANSLFRNSDTNAFAISLGQLNANNDWYGTNTFHAVADFTGAYVLFSDNIDLSSGNGILMTNAAYQSYGTGGFTVAGSGSFTGNGANLTNIPAVGLAASGTLPGWDGSALTNMPIRRIYTDVGTYSNFSTIETMWWTNATGIPANLLANNGDTLEFVFRGGNTNLAASVVFKIGMGGTLVYNPGSQTLLTLSAWQLDAVLTRTNTTGGTLAVKLVSGTSPRDFRIVPVGLTWSANNNFGLSAAVTTSLGTNGMVVANGGFGTYYRASNSPQ